MYRLQAVVMMTSSMTSYPQNGQQLVLVRQNNQMDASFLNERCFVSLLHGTGTEASLGAKSRLLSFNLVVVSASLEMTYGGQLD